MSGNNTRARGYSPIRSYRANEKTGRAERHAREACFVRRKSVRVSRYQTVIRACLFRPQGIREGGLRPRKSENGRTILTLSARFR